MKKYTIKKRLQAVHKIFKTTGRICNIAEIIMVIIALSISLSACSKGDSDKGNEGKESAETVAESAKDVDDGDTDDDSDSNDSSDDEENADKEDSDSGDDADDSADDDGKIEKEETVTAKADAYGKVREVKVSDVLKIKEHMSDIKDTSILEDIKNKSGDEEFTKDGKNITWQNHGENITYEGKADKKLPIDVKLTYYLDGEKISAEDIAGKSGDVKIKVRYKVKEKYKAKVSGKTIKVPYPFMAVTMVMLSEDHFKDIEVDNGSVMGTDDTQIVMGLALPGLKEALQLSKYDDKDGLDLKDIDIPSSVEITAKAENFELDYTATILTNGILDEIKNKDIKKLDDMTDDMDDLGEASEKIADALDKLADGSSDYSDYLSKYMDGVESLYSGLNKLNKGLKKVDISALSGTGANGKKSSDKATKEAIKSLKKDSKTIAGILGSKEWSELGKTLATSAGEYISDPSKIADDKNLSVSDKKALAAAIKQGNAAMEAGLKANGASKNDIEKIKNAYAQAAGAGVANKLGETQIKTLSLTTASLLKSLSTLSNTLSSLSGMSDKMSDFSDSIKSLKTAVSRLTIGAKKLAQTGSKLESGYGKIDSGISKIADKYGDFDEDGIQKLSDAFGNDLSEIFDKVKALRKADKTYDSFTGKGQDMKSSVRFVIETDEIKK